MGNKNIIELNKLSHQKKARTEYRVHTGYLNKIKIWVNVAKLIMANGEESRDSTVNQRDLDPYLPAFLTSLNKALSIVSYQNLFVCSDMFIQS